MRTPWLSPASQSEVKIILPFAVRTGETTMSETTDALRRLVEITGTPSCRVLLDTFWKHSSVEVSAFPLCAMASLAVHSICRPYLSSDGRLPSRLRQSMAKEPTAREPVPDTSCRGLTKRVHIFRLHHSAYAWVPPGPAAIVVSLIKLILQLDSGG